MFLFSAKAIYGVKEWGESSKETLESLVVLIFLTKLCRVYNNKILCLLPNTSLLYTHLKSLACHSIRTFFDQCSQWPQALIPNSNMVSSPFTVGSSVTAECFRRNSSIFSLSSGSKRAPADHITAKMNKRAICSLLSCFSFRSDNKPCRADVICNYCPPRTMSQHK